MILVCQKYNLQTSFVYPHLSQSGAQAEGSGEASEEGHPMSLRNYLEQEEADDRFSLAHFRIPKCLGGFFRDLYKRGLEGSGGEMITTQERG